MLVLWGPPTSRDVWQESTALEKFPRGNPHIFGPALKIAWGLHPHHIFKGLGAAPKETAGWSVLLGAEVTSLKCLEKS